MYTLKRIIIGISALSLVFSLAPRAVLAQDELLGDRVEYIRTHCVDAQVSLKQFQKSELVTRYVRGRSYEQVLKQMTALNTRMTANKINATELVGLATEMQSSVAQFRAAYDQRYDKTLLTATRLQCQEKPAEFYNLVAQARTERSAVAVETARVAQAIAKYREAVIKSKAALSAQTNTGGQ